MDASRKTPERGHPDPVRQIWSALDYKIQWLREGEVRVCRETETA